MSENAWIFVTDRETWPEVVRYGSFGVKDKPGRIEAARVGDPCLAYVKGESLFAGFGEITRSYYRDESGTYGEFVHRLGIDIRLDLGNAVNIQPLISDLTFVSDKAHWPLSLQGGVVKIPIADFSLIKANLERQRLVLSDLKEIPSEAAPDKSNIADSILNRPELSSKSLHDRLAEIIHLVGLQMGYDSVQRFKTHSDSPYQIDVAWLQKRNPRIAVEIHDKGNLVEALARLRHARDFNFSKVILVIVDKSDLKRCLEILRFDEKLTHWMDLWSIESVYKMYTACIEFQGLYRKFEESTYKEQIQNDLF